MVVLIVLGWILGIFLLLGTLFFFFYRFVFLRDPERNIPPGNVVVSPADGKIIQITEISAKTAQVRKGWLGKVLISPLFNGHCYLISIFMSPLDVHINRAPVGGNAASIKYNRGSFFNAGNLEGSFSNENNQILFHTAIGNVLVVQIAGFLARRIECWVKINQKVNKGEKIGMINLGSQVSMLVPKRGLRLNVSIGERVKGGESVIAHVVR